uniref:SET and MYND domain containing 3 n=1 Tax=Leptobrachium leishanense TaxID=445787 RepID=A0A8C5MWQ2_9ANUR
TGCCVGNHHCSRCSSVMRQTGGSYLCPRRKKIHFGIKKTKTRSRTCCKDDLVKHPLILDILCLFLQVTCNSFTISDGEMQDVGVGLYPSMSLLNHSCDPNCVIVFEGKCLHLRTVKEIPKGEEDKDMLAGDEQASKSMEMALAKGIEVLAMCKALLTSSQLPDRNIHQLKVLDSAMDACIKLGLWEEALLFGLRTLQPYSLYYSDYHPVKAIQMMKVGKLQHYHGIFHDAMTRRLVRERTLLESLQSKRVFLGGQMQ